MRPVTKTGNAADESGEGGQMDNTAGEQAVAHGT